MRRIEKKVLKKIKELPTIGGWYVGSFTEISKMTNLTTFRVKNIIRKLEKEGLIKTKKNFALFGTMFKICYN